MTPIPVGAHNEAEFLEYVNDMKFGRGLIRRDYNLYASGYHEAVPQFPRELLVPPNKQQGMLEAQQTNKTSLYDLRNLYYSVLQSLNQGQHPLCWAFSSTKAAMYARVRMGLPGAILSPWWVAGRYQNWRDQGGLGIWSSTIIGTQGAPLMEKCPSYSSKYDTSDVGSDAGLHKNVCFFDGTDNADDNEQIMISAFLRDDMIPVLDFNWLEHSMCGGRLVSLGNGLTVDADNSWGDIGQYGEKGYYRLTGAHARPDNVCVCWIQSPSMN